MWGCGTTVCLILGCCGCQILTTVVCWIRTTGQVQWKTLEKYLKASWHVLMYFHGILPMNIPRKLYFLKAMKMGNLWNAYERMQNITNWKYHERPMKLLAWTRSMEKPWNLFPSNETYEKPCHPTSPMKKPWRLIPSNHPHEKTMKIGSTKQK